MRKLLFAVVAIAIVVVSGAASAIPVQWTAASGGNDHWYDVVVAPSQWQQSLNEATTRAHDGQAGYLATITSAGEQAFITSVFGSLRGYWLGGSDLQQEGTWRWMSGPEAGQVFYIAGSQPGYSFFEPFFSEPNGGINENFLELKSFGNQFPSGPNTWNDTPDYFAVGYLVEFNPRIVTTTPVSEPGTLALVGVGLVGLAALRAKLSYSDRLLAHALPMIAKGQKQQCERRPS